MSQNLHENTWTDIFLWNMRKSFNSNYFKEYLKTTASSFLELYIKRDKI